MATNLYVGQLFDSYCQFLTYLKAYEKEHFVCFCKVDSIIIKEVQHSAKPELKYCKIRFVCVRGGFLKAKGRGIRRTSSLKCGCPAFVYLHATPDGNHLEIRKLNQCHNHELSEEAFKRLPQQRRLPPDVKKSAQEMLSLKVNKKMLLQKLQSETGKMVTMKDINNLISEQRSHARRNEIVLQQGPENHAETNANEDVAETCNDGNVSEDKANEPVSHDHYYEEETTSDKPVFQDDDDKMVFVQNRANKAVADLVREKKRSNDLKERLLAVNTLLLEESRKRNSYLHALVQTNDVNARLLEESRRRNNCLEALLKLQSTSHNQSFEEPMQS